jgi:hypothetical protein
MNPLTQFKKVLILPLLIAVALVVVPRNARVRACQRNAGDGTLSVWLAQLDMQRVSGLGVVPQDEYQRRFGRLCRSKHVASRGAQWVAHASGAQPDHGHIWRAHSLRC